MHIWVDESAKLIKFETVWDWLPSKVAVRIVETCGLLPFVAASQHRISDETRVVPWDHCKVQVILVYLLHFYRLHLFIISSRSIFIILLLFPEEISIACDNLWALHQELIHRLLMRLQVSTALRSLLKMNLLNTVSRVTKHGVSLFMVVAVRGSWESHCHSLDL
jgi:hypothetical protein